MMVASKVFSASRIATDVWVNAAGLITMPHAASPCPRPNYPPLSAARSHNWPVHRRYRESSGVEEHRLPIALKKDVESVDDCTVSLRPGRYQRSAPLRLLDNVQDRILGICRFFVIKIHARGQADIDAARGQPKIYMRRH